MAMLFTGRAKPWPSSGATMYSTGKPRSRRATTIWSDSALLTRGIVRALHDEQRRLDLVRGVQRRLPFELRPAFAASRVAHALGKDLADRLPVGRDRFEQRDQVRRADDGDARGVEVGREGDAGQGRVAAVGAAHDADALRVGDAFRDQMLHAPGEVVLHLLAPLVVAGVEELLAVAGRAAEVRLQDGVAAVGEELREPSVAPGVAPPGAAVRERRRAAGSCRARPSAGSGRPGSRARRTTCSGRPSSPPGAARGSFSRTRYWSVSFLLVAVEEVGLAGLGVAARRRPAGDARPSCSNRSRSPCRAAFSARSS